jgi:hypothetical protein
MAHKEENRTIEDDTEIAWYYGKYYLFSKKASKSNKQLILSVRYYCDICRTTIFTKVL